VPTKLPGLLTSAGFEIVSCATVPMMRAGYLDIDTGSFIGNWAFKVVQDKAKGHHIDKGDVDAVRTPFWAGNDAASHCHKPGRHQPGRRQPRHHQPRHHLQLKKFVTEMKEHAERGAFFGCVHRFLFLVRKPLHSS